MTEWINRWQSLSERERSLVVISSVISLLVVFYVFLFQPLRAERNMLTAKLDAQVSVFEELQPLVAELNQLPEVAGAINKGASEREIIEELVAMQGLAGDMGQEKDWWVIGLEKVAFRDVVNFMGAAHTAGFSISELNVVLSTGGGGVVDVHMVLVGQF